MARYVIFIGAGAVLFAVFLSLYFYYRDKKATMAKVFSVLTVVGLLVFLLGLADFGRPYLVFFFPNAGDYILIGIFVICLLLAYWLIIRPAFSVKQDKIEEVTKITATGTRTYSPGTSAKKKKKNKNNSMKAQMGTSKKRHIPRY